MKIPYGDADFGRIRTEGSFYADKTPFLRVLEASPRFLVFLRPRRFGKSTFLSMMDHYYDLERKEEFDALFKGLWVHGSPTPERGSYLTWRLDFSSVATDATDQGEETLRKTFLGAVIARTSTFLSKYEALIPELRGIRERIDAYERAEILVDRVLGAVVGTGHRVYLLIDEYDHFANRLLASQQERLYEAVITKTGFVRTFYAALKAATGTGALARMFITGVSPLMLDDLSSGFNISTHVSLDPQLAGLAGFTRPEVELAVDRFLASRPRLAEVPGAGSREALLSVMERCYNGYRFSPRADLRVFNSDMVLYLLQQIDRMGELPNDMLDLNVRTEYSHLQKIGVGAGASAEARRGLLREIAASGRVRSQLVERFGAGALTSDASFASLLYYLGMLTLGAEGRSPEGYDLEIPNRVIRALQWEHLAELLEKEDGIQVGIQAITNALSALAVRGDLAPFLALFHKEILQKVSVRDLRGLDEKTIKLLLMVYASLGHVFYPLVEKEFAQGFTDLFLGANRQFPTARYSWLFEIKYLPTTAKPAAIDRAFAEAQSQVERYLLDQTLLPLLVQSGGELRSGMLVFVGAKRALFRPVGAGVTLDVGARAAPKKAGRSRAKKLASAPKRRPAKKVVKALASTPAKKPARTKSSRSARG